jgi:hypothetical protein
MVSNVLPLRLALQPGMTVADVVDQTSQRLHVRICSTSAYQLADLRHDVGGEIDGRTLFGVSINVMPFDYDFALPAMRVCKQSVFGPVRRPEHFRLRPRRRRAASGRLRYQSALHTRPISNTIGRDF